jgi:hypothetical protein
MHVLERYNCDVDELCLLSASVDHFCRRSFLFPSETYELIAFSVFRCIPRSSARSISIDFLLVSYDYRSKPDNSAGTCTE